MTGTDDQPGPSADLRRRAEAASGEQASRSPETRVTTSPEEMQRLLHELQVHQIELELQNEELRLAQVELDTARARYFDLYDLAPVGFVTVGEAGVILEANLTAATLLGVSRGDLVKLPLSKFILREDQDSYYLYRKRLLETDAPHGFELRLVKKDGTVFWAHLETTMARLPTSSPGQEGERRPELSIVISDIDQHKQAEAELRKSEEKYHGLFRNATLGIFHSTFEGRFIDVNPALARLLGYDSPEEAVRLVTNIAEQVYADPPHRDAVAAAAMKAGGTVSSENLYRRRDGSLWSGMLHLRIISDREGRPSHFEGFVGDITEHKRLAEEKIQLQDQLRQAQKMEAIGRLAGGVAHDFNNITAIVLGYGEMLLARLGPEDPSRKQVEQIVAAGHRSATLTRQLLAFSRRQTMLPGVLDLNSLLINFEKMLGRLIREDIHLELKLAPELGRVTADPGQLEQVVTNLVVNARDAMPKGGRLTIETADVELNDGSAQGREVVVPGKYVLLALTDTGCGMDQAALARLFEPFYTTKERGKGTGLGLATAYGIVKQSAGYIWATSEPGVGTTFRIYLPRTDAQPQAPAAETAGEAPRGSGELILLVEDEAPLRELCEAILSQLGYRVIAAASGPEALRLVLERGVAPALLLTDVIMPGMSGAQLAQRLQSHRPGLNVVYMSGYPDDAIAPHGVHAPGLHFIQKPFTERALAALLRDVLGGQTAAPAGRRVLMIDDDEQYRELVQIFCSKHGHRFAGVGSAAAAIKALAGSAFDVLLVDLNIPGTSGEDVLREIRAAGYATPAIVLTGDVSSADMGVLRPLGVLQALEKSSNRGPLLEAIESATP